MRRFDSGFAIPPRAFEILVDSNGHSTRKLDLSMMEAFVDLEELRLHLICHENHSFSDRCDNLDGLRMMLDATPKLVTLDLLLPDDLDSADDSFYPYSSVFPACGYWPHLLKLGLSNIDVHLVDLIELLAVQLPKLRTLHLGSIRLLEGTWQGLFESVKYACQLESLFFEEDVLLDEQGEDVFEVNAQLIDFDFEGFLQYIIHGRDDPHLRHPLLRSNQPSFKSMEYLRQTLQTIQSIGSGSKAISVVRKALEDGTQLYSEALKDYKPSVTEGLEDTKEITLRAVKRDGELAFDATFEDSVRSFTAEAFANLVIARMSELKEPSAEGTIEFREHF